MLKLLISSAASDRLSAAGQFLSGFPHSAEILVIGGTRATADDFVRHYARLQGATFGIHRFSLVQLAARISALRLAAEGQVPCSALGIEAAVVRAVHDAHSNGSLQYFSSVALLPGFAKAVRATTSELRAAGITADDLEHLPPPASDVSSLLAAIDGQLAAAHLVDMASVMRIAASALRDNEVSLASAPVLLLDVAIHSKAEYEFVEALVTRAPQALVTMPAEDEKSVAAVETWPGAAESIEQCATEESPLGRSPGWTLIETGVKLARDLPKSTEVRIAVAASFAARLSRETRALLLPRQKFQEPLPFPATNIPAAYESRVLSEYLAAASR
jgi:hypothetical protein